MRCYRHCSSSRNPHRLPRLLTLSFVPGILSFALPHSTDLVSRSGLRLFLFAGKGLRKSGLVHRHSVDAVPCRRVWVSHGSDSHIFRSLISAVPLSEADKEALLRSKTVYWLKILSLS